MDNKINKIYAYLHCFRTAIKAKSMTDPEKGAEIIVDPVTQISCGECKTDIDVSEFEPFSKVQCPKCGHTETVPAKIGSFHLLDLLGTGGMGGVVYLARDESLGRMVAIKVMPASLGDSKELFQQFKREAQAAAKLNHPHIAQIYSFGQQHGQPYIVMELVTGKGFDTLIERGGALDPATALQIGLEIAEGLEAASDIGLVHGDIKPENILLDDKMHAKLVDFGLASFADQAGEKGIWGTPYYIAPEKIKRQKADARSDIYCLGATLYHALAGHPPFEGDTPIEVVKARLDGPPPELSTVRPELDEQVSKIVARMLQTEPSMRYPTYASLTGDMRKVLSQLSPPAKGPGLRTKSGKRVVLKKRSGGSATVVRTAAGPTPSGKLIVPKKAVAESVSRQAGTAPDRGEKKKRGKGCLKAFLITFLVLLVLSGLAGLGIYIKIRKEVTLAVRREQFRLGQARKQAAEQSALLYTSVSNTVELVREVDDFGERASNAVSVVTGKPLDWPLPAAPEMAQPEAPAAPEEGDAPEGGEAVEGQTGADDEAEAPDEEAGGADEEEAERNAEEAGDGEQAEAGAEAQEEAPPEPVAPAEPEPEIVLLARDAIRGTETIRVLAMEAREIRQAARLTETVAQNAPLSAVAEAALAELEAHLESAKRKETSAREALDTATRALERVETLRDREVARNERERLAREEEARRQGEEEAARRAEEAQRQLEENERQLLDGAHATIVPKLKVHAYEEARDLLKAQLPSYRSDAGKAGMAVLIERCERLIGLKEFVIEHLNEQPYKWGWGRGAESTDVLGAIPTGVRIKGAIVPWREVGTAQMLKLIRYCLKIRTVKVRTLAEQNLATAIFCFENGGADTATQFAATALDLSPHMGEDIERLLPPEARR